ncbi:MAG: helix-turn-helix transcriptional regulator [Bacteroidetes bacterium]|nr:helix-turn-helix transcriptional regulator [Bacteroidota bacterium]
MQPDHFAELVRSRRCSASFILAVNDSLNAISGKWKLPIIGVLLFGKRRFRDLEREIPGISPRMLSKELKELELNGIVSRQVYHTVPVAVEYALTESGRQLDGLLGAMVEWGLHHRKLLMIGPEPSLQEP